jgi:hypothetical protein
MWEEFDRTRFGWNSIPTVGTRTDILSWYSMLLSQLVLGHVDGGLKLHNTYNKHDGFLIG